MLPWRLLAVLFVFCLPLGCRNVQAPTGTAEKESPALSRVRAVFARIPDVLARNHKTFNGPSGPVAGFGAGEVYPQIWLRDSSWMVDAAAASYPAEALTSWLDLHLATAERSGRLRDWVAPGSVAAFREWAPRAQEKAGVVFDTNTNESDQEPSAALAWCRFERLSGPDARRGEGREGRVEALVSAMDALVRERTDPASGLIWSGLTADWGDVSPLHPDQRAIYLDPKTPRTLSLYSNVMAWAGLDCLASLEGPAPRQQALAARAAKLREGIRTSFWMETRGYFRIRRTLDPLPKGFEDEDARFALGGNALAALFGVADDVQAASIFAVAERLRTESGFSTISTTLIPPYAAGTFRHPAMREPFQYQNGGQWDWFGAPLVQAEFERGHSEHARAHLDQILTRTLRAGPGLHEWYGQDGSAKGSPAYAASAAALHNVIVKGLLGISRSASGAYRVVLRTGGTLQPFEFANRAAGTSLKVSQIVGDAAIDVRVEGAAEVSQVCTLVPVGRSPEEPGAQAGSPPRSVLRVGADTLMCADVSSSAPVRLRFPLRR